MKNVVLEGYNSTWSQRCYFPILHEKAEKGDIGLWAIDIVRSPESDNIHYVNKIEQADNYSKLADMNLVFIVTPPQYHIAVAEFWLPRLTEAGKIFIEKPLDISVVDAELFGKVIHKEKKEGSIFGFDHYLARSYLFQKNIKKIIQKIGSIKSIEFRILEDYPIPQERAGTLNDGIIHDLFCHVLAVVCSTVSGETYILPDSIKKVKIIDVKTARYEGSPISGETFATIEFELDKIDVEVVFGKSVGNSPDKSMAIYGSEGVVILDFEQCELDIFNLKKKLLQTEKLYHNPVEIFLKEVLDGVKLDQVPGVFSYDTALAILKKLEETKKKIRGNMVEYQCGSTLEDILKLL